jgi:hypothetical protein
MRDARASPEVALLPAVLRREAEAVAKRVEGETGCERMTGRASEFVYVLNGYLFVAAPFVALAVALLLWLSTRD